jgi:hypothetical protein
MDMDLLYLYQRIETLELHLNKLLFGQTHLPVDDPLVQAKTDLTEWRAGVKCGRATYLQGWQLWQAALHTLDWETRLAGLWGDSDERMAA